MFQYDNSSVVTSLQKGSSNDPASMHLVHCLWFLIAYYDIDLACEHRPGSSNATADYLSRNNLQSFLLRHPNNQPRCHVSYSQSQQYLALTGHLQPSMLHS